MAAFIAQQPNGLYCRFSHITDCPTHWNMTREDYINNVTGTTLSKEDAEDTLDNHLQSFQLVIDKFKPINMKPNEFIEWLNIVSRPCKTGWNDSLREEEE